MKDHSRLRQPYRFLLHANIFCAFMVGVFAGYKLSMAFARHEGIDLNAPHQQPGPWLIVGIGMMLGAPIVASFLFNATAAMILRRLGKISQAEMLLMMLRMNSPVSLTEINEEETPLQN